MNSPTRENFVTIFLRKEDKEKVVDAARKDKRSLSQFCRIKVMEGLE